VLAAGGALQLAPAQAGAGPAPRLVTAARCGLCKACRGGANRSCMVADATRLAASGHTGAALTAAGAAAVGTRLDIWWPIDERYYSGAITAFNAVSCEHRVLYDDDVPEWRGLWKEAVNVLRADAAPPQAGTPPPLLLEGPRRAEEATPSEGAAAPAAAGRPRRAAALQPGSYAVMWDLPHESRSTRCAECRKQKKGQCGKARPCASSCRHAADCRRQPTSSRRCLNRTPGMPVVKSSHHKKRKAEAGGAEAESSDSEDSEAEAEAAPVQWAAVPGFVPPA